MRSLVALNHPALRAYSELPHANTRAAGASHALLHAHRVKTARTSPRARKHTSSAQKPGSWAQALCWRPMAGPRRPHQPRASRTTRARRTTTHAATRAPQCTSHCSLRPLHKRLHLLQAPYRTGARRDRQDASPRGARGGTPRAQATELALRYPSRAAVQSACRLHSSPACSEHSARVLRAAPLPPRAWSALHEARAWHAARTLRHPFSPLSSLPAHSTEHTLPACLHTQQSTQHTAPCARIRLTTQPAPHNNSLPHASPRRLALTPPAARSEKLQRAPLPAVTSFLSVHSETFSFTPPPRLPGHSPQQ